VEKGRGAGYQSGSGSQPGTTVDQDFFERAGKEESSRL
jgi:hypothetical protein